MAAGRREGKGRSAVCPTSKAVASAAPEPTATVEVERAVAALTSLREEGDLGVIAAVACGTPAIPLLRHLLFAREPSGLYEPRRRAVEALAALHAYEVLIEYLRLLHEITDPVEETGEQAVINAAARALAEWGDATVVPLLLEFTSRPPLPGVVDALGKLRRREALPYFITALADDSSRPAAEAALRALDPEAFSALLEIALVHVPSEGAESVSSLRRRQSALALLAEMAPDSQTFWPALRSLTREGDPRVRALAWRIALAGAPESDRHEAVKRLIGLLSHSDFVLREEIGGWLAEYYDIARESVTEALRNAEFLPEPPPAVRTLRRVVARVAAAARD